MRPDGPVAFEPVGASHYALLRDWLQRPHVREWWGDPDEELGFVRDMVEGRDTTRPYLITLDRRPVGYIQVWFVGDHQTESWLVEHPWLAELPADAVGVDLTIGEPELLSQGLGSRALRAFVERLRADGHRTIAIDPDPANARAVRAYEKAGFRARGRFKSGAEDVLLMVFDDSLPVAGD